MHKKTDFLLGILLGGTAAMMAFKRMDPVQRHKLLNKVDYKLDSLKNNAIDYAFYTDNEFNKASQSLKKKTGDTGSAIQGINQKAQRLRRQHPISHLYVKTVHLTSTLKNAHHKDKAANDDIVLNAGEALHDSKTVVYYPDGKVKAF